MDDRFLDSNSDENMNANKESYKYLIKYREFYKITYH